MRYNVFKDYGYVNEVLIGQFDSLETARARAEEEAEISFADEVIEVATFSEKGEYITHFKTMGAAFSVEDYANNDERDEDDAWYWDYNSPASYHHY